MGRTKKFMYNSISTAIYQVVVMIIGIITPRILLKYYGSELNGLVSSINQFITYFSLVEAGIAGAAVYSLYKPLADKDHETINKIVSTARNFYFKAGYIFTFLIIILSLLYPIIITTKELSYPMMAILILVLGAKFFLDFFTLSKYRVLLTADQKTYIISIASTCYVILQMIIVIILTYLKFNIVVVYATSILALMTRSLILMIYVKRNYKNVKFTEKADENLLDKRWDALFLQILGAVQHGAPVLIATFLISLKDVSVYTVYNMVFVGLSGVLGIFTSGLSASFGDVIVRNDKKLLNKTYNEFEYSYFIIITIVYIVTSIMIIPFITLYTDGITDINYIKPIYGILFVTNAFISSLKTPHGMLVIAGGKYKETRVQNIIQASIIVIGGIILAPIFGIVGILIASIISNLYRLIEQCIFVPKNILKVKSGKVFVRMTIYTIIFISGICASTFINIYIDNYFQWCLYSALFFVLTSIVVILISYMFDKNQIKEIYARVKRLILNKI